MRDASRVPLLTRRAARARAQQQMCLLVREALSVGKMAIAKHFFSTELALTEAKMRIRDELSSYCVVTEAPKTTFGKVRRAVVIPTPTPFSNPNP